MSRYTSSGSSGHHCEYIPSFGGYYRLSWEVDYYYSGSRLRFPRQFSRDTDEDGARRFCKKWGLPLPDNLQPAAQPRPAEPEGEGEGE